MGKRAVVSRRGLAGWIIGALLASSLVFQGTFGPGASSALAAPACSAGLVTPLHGSKVYFDTKFGNHRGMYLGYKVSVSSAVSVASINISIPGGSNDAIDLETGQPTTQQLGAISAGGAAQSYFLVEAKSPKTNTSTAVTVTLTLDGVACEVTDTITA